MAVKVKLNLAGSGEYVEVNGRTVRECLYDFLRQLPKTRDWPFDDQGTLQSLVLANNHFVTGEQLDKPVTGVWS